jgi:hypothetical protein
MSRVGTVGVGSGEWRFFCYGRLWRCPLQKQRHAIIIPDPEKTLRHIFGTANRASKISGFQFKTSPVLNSVAFLYAATSSLAGFGYRMRYAPYYPSYFLRNIVSWPNYSGLIWVLLAASSHTIYKAKISLAMKSDIW